jgi:hypothetical protein
MVRSSVSWSKAHAAVARRVNMLDSPDYLEHDAAMIPPVHSRPHVTPERRRQAGPRDRN